MAWEKVFTIGFDTQSHTFNSNLYRYRIAGSIGTSNVLFFHPTTLEIVKNIDVYQGGYTNVTGLYGTYKINKGSGYDVDLQRELINTAPTTPGAFTSPTSGTVLKGDSDYTVAWGASIDPDGNFNNYNLAQQYNDNSTEHNLTTNTVTNRNFTVPKFVPGTTTTLTTKVRFVVYGVDSQGEKSAARYSEWYTITHNAIPTLTLSTTDAQTLYENDIFAINGTATDTDSGNVLSVKYSIDGGTARAILANISTGSAISFAKNLTFKSGMLYDGATAISGALAEGSQHTLKVWAEDDKGGKSPDIIRTFYVVPNRAATLILNAFVTRTGLIDTDVVNVSGTVADLDTNNVIVKYKIGNGAFVEVFNGQANATPKSFDFNLLLADLKEGENTITIQAVDIYNAVTQQILTLRKSKNEVPLTSAVTYYEIIPPNGTADGIVLWIERELGDLNVKAEVSMGMPGETEVFKPMFLESTANLTNSNVEDTFKFDNEGVAASKVVVRITQTRSGTTENKAIRKISGVLS